MQSIQLQSHIRSDGILKVDVPVGLADMDLEVMIIVQPIAPNSDQTIADGNGWPEGFFEQTFGSLADEALVREEQGQLERREVRNTLIR